MIDRDTKETESPAPAPDPVCANPDCGHSEDLHTHPAFGLGFCLRCPCPDYVPAAEPAPLDPVLGAIRDLYVLAEGNSPTENGLRIALHQFWRKMKGEQYDGTDRTQFEIRSYGRDGAR